MAGDGPDAGQRADDLTDQHAGQAEPEVLELQQYFEALRKMRECIHQSESPGTLGQRHLQPQAKQSKENRDGARCSCRATFARIPFPQPAAGTEDRLRPRLRIRAVRSPQRTRSDRASLPRPCANDRRAQRQRVRASSSRHGWWKAPTGTRRARGAGSPSPARNHRGREGRARSRSTVQRTARITARRRFRRATSCGRFRRAASNALPIHVGAQAEAGRNGHVPRH